MDTPEKLGANDILKKHGPAGWLVRSLQRYAMLGWLLFFILLGMIFVTNLVKMFVPQPVFAVDEAGHLLGVIEYLKPTSRTDQEIIAASKYFIQNFLSLNSATIFEDYAAAMNMMASAYLAETQKAVKDDNYLARVAAAKSRSWLEFAATDGAKIVERRNMNAQVRLRGNIVVDAGGGRVEKPFDVMLETEVVARNTNNTSGLVILNRKDN